jgi:branched-chain amino acid transport system permease protein
MDPSLAGILLVDGLTHGVIYAQLAVACVLIFSVTRIAFIALGEFATFGALSLAALHAGRVPGTLWLMLALAFASVLLDAAGALRRHEPLVRVVAAAVRGLSLPILIAVVVYWGSARGWPLWANSLLALAIVTALGPYTYRLAFERLADANILTLMIASVGVHFAMTGLGLVFFGAEGSRNPSYWEGATMAGSLRIANQALLTAIVSILLVVALWLAFRFSLRGKALRATAIDRFGARLVGISPARAGRLTFAVASLLAALAGMLAAPGTTLFYDSGLVIGLKGFVAAVAGGLLSYPVAAAAALGLGLIESFGSFYASAYKEAVVFTAILPVLLWLSIKHRQAGGEA